MRTLTEIEVRTIRASLTERARIYTGDRSAEVRALAEEFAGKRVYVLGDDEAAVFASPNETAQSSALYE